ncbi:MAG: hypothetical protein J0L53_07070 [Spirochaetes bacterium]|nr:hypothetical protein [Spirochaetota bacterium]MBX3720284.1 hypothetical protein [Turneriella sp.]
MKKLKPSLLILGAILIGSASVLQAAPKAAATPAVSTASVPENLPVERNQNPVLDATAFGLGTGTYGGYGFLGGALQIGVANWLRLSGGITGSLLGDQPSGSFALSNYSLLWHFTGGLVFTSTKVYKGIARPYTSLNLTYFYDAKMKAGGINGTFVIGVDLYMTQDYSIYIEAGVNAPFIRDLLAPQLTGGLVGIGARTFF